MSEPTTFTVLDLSTAHLSPEEAAEMNAGGCPIAPCIDTRYGWMVYAGEPGDDPACFEDEPEGSWPGLRAARQLAQSMGCRFVWFDADAEEVAGPPSWEW